MNMAFASHHFAVIADLQIAVPKVVKEVTPEHAFNSRVSVSALNAGEVANRFASLFDESMSSHEHHELSIDDFTMSSLMLFITPPINVCHNVRVLPSGLGFQATLCPCHSDEMMHGFKGCFCRA